MVDMQYVDSSNIEAVGFDGDAGELVVQFLSGKTYTYSGVPEETFLALLASNSKGSFLNREIKGVYAYAET